MNDSDEWIEINSNKKNIQSKEKRVPKNITNEEIVNIFTPILQQFGASGAFLFGSRVKKSNRIDSDIDLIVFWKSKCSNSPSINILLSKLWKSFGLHVDLINMQFKEKSNKNFHKTDQLECFFSEVSSNSIKLFGMYSIEYYIDSSQYNNHLSI